MADKLLVSDYDEEFCFHSIQLYFSYYISTDKQLAY